MKPVGYIHTPFTDLAQSVPIQGRLDPETRGHIELLPEYRDGCLHLEGFSHLFLIYLFHRSTKEVLTSRPYLDDEEHGIFSIRSPHRPNHLGLTLVELEGIENTVLRIKGVDMLHMTPLLDIKPFNPYFDTAEMVRIGWMEQYFRNGRPGKTRIRGKKEWLHEE